MKVQAATKCCPKVADFTVFLEEEDDQQKQRLKIEFFRFQQLHIFGLETTKTEEVSENRTMISLLKTTAQKFKLLLYTFRPRKLAKRRTVKTILVTSEKRNVFIKGTVKIRTYASKKVKPSIKFKNHPEVCINYEAKPPLFRDFAL